MTIRERQRSLSCGLNSRSFGPMEVVDSPLNLAHLQCRKADRLLAAGKYEEAISCHAKAADLLWDAMKLTDCEQARLSMELQRDSHVKQQHLLQERWRREMRREANKARHGLTHPPASAKPQAHRGPERPDVQEREYDTLLYQLQVRHSPPPLASCPGSKTTKDDKTRLEEQQTTIQDLRRLVDQLTDENQRLAAENRRLCSENVRLCSEAADFVERSELWVLPQAGSAVAAGGAERKTTGKGRDIAIPQLPPLEMPAHEDLGLDDLPPLEDIQNELRELLD